MVLAVIAVPGGAATQVFGPSGDESTAASPELEAAARAQRADRHQREESGSSTTAGSASATTGSTAPSATEQANQPATDATAATDPATGSATTGSTTSSGSGTSGSSTAGGSTTGGSTTGTTTSGTTSATAAALLSGASNGLLDVTELTSGSTSSAAWRNVVAAASDRSGGVDLANQDNTHAARTLAAALVYARTGDTASRNQVVATLRQLPSASLSGARVLSVARQLGGYAIAADVIGYRDAAFQTWIGDMRTKNIGNHGRWVALTQTSEDSPNNWGAWALASRIAISSYLGDTTDLARAATVYRGFVGESSAYSGFRHTSDYDPSWSCGGDVPINPASCGDRSGAIVEDISRSAGSYPSVDKTGLTYSWEVLGGATMSSRLLESAGYTDVWEWGDRALLRAAVFLKDHGGYSPAYRVNQYIPYEINRAYGVQLGPLGSVGYGRQFGFTDWLS